MHFKLLKSLSSGYPIGYSSRYLHCVHKLQKDASVVVASAEAQLLVLSKTKVSATTMDLFGMMGKLVYDREGNSQCKSLSMFPA